MRSIQVGLEISSYKMKGRLCSDMQELKRFINSIESPHGNLYCNCLPASNPNKLILEISYSKYYNGIGEGDIDCLEVQNDFCSKIMSHLILGDAILTLNKVNIPFTFPISQNEEFSSYIKMYQILNCVYKIKNQKASTTAFVEVEEFKELSVIYTDSPSSTSYNNRITIGNKNRNIDSKPNDKNNLYECEPVNYELSKEMIIELSRRIMRRGFSLSQFKKFNIYQEYMSNYKQYILNNLLDLGELENFYNEKSQELAMKLLAYKKEADNFCYEVFIYKEINHIYDYQIIHRALKICINDSNERKEAERLIQNTLSEYQSSENTMVMNTYATIKKIRDVIEQDY